MADEIEINFKVIDKNGLLSHGKKSTKLKIVREIISGRMKEETRS